MLPVDRLAAVSRDMFRIVPAGDGLRDAALALLCGGEATGDLFLSAAPTSFPRGAGEIPLDDLLVACAGSRMIGAALAVRRPGKMAFVWPPVVIAGEVADDDRRAAARELLQELARRLDAAGTQFAQSLLETDDVLGKKVLSEGGFPYLTDLLQLSRPATLPKNEPAMPLEAARYSETAHALFAHMIERTFQRTLDCPSLARVRDGAAALEALQNGGQFDPALWEIVRWNGLEAAVLLCADHPERRVREIAYLGVVSEARGRGIGRALVCRALGQARHDGCESVEVAVDAGNRYALEIYRSLGFRVVRKIAVHLRLREEIGAAPR